MTPKEPEILAQRLQPAFRQRLMRGALWLALPALGVVTAFGIAPGTAVDALTRETTTLSWELPEPAAEPRAQDSRFASQDRVLQGDTIASALARLDVLDPTLLEFLRTDPTARQLLRQFVAGRTLYAERDEIGSLLMLRFGLSGSSVLEISRSAEGFSARIKPLATSTKAHYRAGTIRSSLFAATDAAGVPDAVATQLARIFSNDIDFHADLRQGDTFAVIYEVAHGGAETTAPGRVLAAEFINKGRRHTAVLFPDEDGLDAYYDLDGSNRNKSFLRSPIEFSRVSSGFGGRMHPIAGEWRTHTGVDFAAPAGTRVLAAADGVVTFAGWRNGYGNTLEIRHGGNISTLYAHLSRFAPTATVGSRVRQGEPIGFVGATGWATGPHLHYEFKVAGAHQDPMRVALPRARGVPAQDKPRFLAEAGLAGTRLESVRESGSSRFE